jgi:hypothetical protein
VKPGCQRCRSERDCFKGLGGGAGAGVVGDIQVHLEGADVAAGAELLGRRSGMVGVAR